MEFGMPNKIDAVQLHGARRNKKSEGSVAVSRRSGRFNRKGNFGLVLRINVFTFVLKSECRISKEGIISIFIN
jgi:hypothetical protein